KEFGAGGRIELSAFYFRRLKRIVPPVLALIAAAVLVTPFLSGDDAAPYVRELPSALGFFANWWQIVVKQSYFDPTPHALKYLWSLAVEMQFYLLWPLIVWGLRKKMGAKATGWVSIVLALLSTAWMWFLYEQNSAGSDQNRIYLGTDTHAMGLLAGAALAGFWNPSAPATERPLLRRLARVIALLALAMLAFMTLVLNSASPVLYQGCFLVVPVLTCILIYCTVSDPAFFVSGLLRHPLMQWTGSRSYSLYLVHWLVFVWMRLLGFKDFSVWWVLAGGLAAVVALSELMFRCVESPSNTFKAQGWNNEQMRSVAYAYAALAVAVVTTAAFLPAATLEDKGAAVPAASAIPDADKLLAQKGGAPASPSDVAAPLANAIDSSPYNGERYSGGEDIHVIGDSVMLGAKYHLSKAIPGIQVDAVVGRQASQGLLVAQEWRRSPHSASTVLVHLGTNGYINEGQFRDMLRELADCKSVVIVNVHAERRWTAPNNELIAQMQDEFPNVHVINWSAISAERPDYFVKDGIHLTTQGIRALTSEIALATGGKLMPPLETDRMLADAGHVHTTGRKAARANGRVHAARATATTGSVKDAGQPQGAPAAGPAAESGTPEAVIAPPPVLSKTLQIE
ncbi:MAG: acyltransferase family protein, partial [Massilia sp.]